MTQIDGRIYLASRSPRRRELLKQIGVTYELMLLRENPQRGADVKETPLPDEAPVAYVTRIAQIKAESGWRIVMKRRIPQYPVLAADTTVVIDNEILGKPEDAQHAQRMLRRLSGHTHQVLTAVAVACNDQVTTVLSTSAVEFRELTDDEIRRYVVGGEPLDKAGAYAIQGRAAVFARRITGSYSGIMGLPLFETAELLRNHDVTPL
jgi:septum formation protein